MEEVTDKELSIVDKSIHDAKTQLDKTKKEDIEKIYRVILNQKPPQQVVKFHDYGKFEYIPITLVERMLDGLFEYWSVDVLREGHVINGFYVVVKLTVKLPRIDKVIKTDGIGFAEFQTAKGAAPTDFTQLMPGAGVLAVPRAKAEAVKNAAKQLGDLFGRNISRKDDNAMAEHEVVGASRKKIAITLENSYETS